MGILNEIHKKRKENSLVLRVGDKFSYREPEKTWKDKVLVAERIFYGNFEVEKIDLRKVYASYYDLDEFRIGTDCGLVGVDKQIYKVV
jgi:hypothetical protein